MVGIRVVVAMVFILVWSACGTTQQPVQSHVMPQPSAAIVPTETSMMPNSAVRPSRYSALFDTIEVPALHVEASRPPSEAFLRNLQQAFIAEIRNENLFATVVANAEARELGGVLTLKATILFWDENPEEGTLEIRLGIEDMGSSCEFTHATTKGALKRIDASEDSVTGQYEITPLVEGTAAFVKDFMRPNPYEL